MKAPPRLVSWYILHKSASLANSISVFDIGAPPVPALNDLIAPVYRGC